MVEAHGEYWGEFVAEDTPIVRTWPNQVSVGGFANNLALHMQVGGHDLTETPWCLVAGKTKQPDGLLLVTLALAAESPNRLGVILLPSWSLARTVTALLRAT